jgi:hypothetical protein
MSIPGKVYTDSGAKVITFLVANTPKAVRSCGHDTASLNIYPLRISGFAGSKIKI